MALLSFVFLHRHGDLGLELRELPMFAIMPFCMALTETETVTTG